jgi:predicted RND superfamily exporter protein
MKERMKEHMNYTVKLLTHIVLTVILLSGCSQMFSSSLATKTYLQKDKILLFIDFEKDSVFEKQNLETLLYATKSAWYIPYSTRVSSFTNYQKITAKGYDLIINDLVINDTVNKDDELTDKRAADLEVEALDNAEVLGLYFNGRSSAVIYVDLELPNQENFTEYVNSLVEVDEHLDALVEKLETRSDVNVKLLGWKKNVGPVSAGSYELPLMIKAGIDRHDPMLLEELDELTQWIRTNDSVVHAFSYADINKRLLSVTRTFDWAKEGTKLEQNQQVRLLYEMSVPFGLGLSNLTNQDGDAYYLHINFSEIDEDMASELVKDLDSWLKVNGKGSFSIAGID